MHCEQAEMLLAQLVFDELPADQKQDVMGHLSTCHACSEQLGDLRVSVNLLGEGERIIKQPVSGYCSRLEHARRLVS